MAKELLKEAIADAKAVREVALQNAKMALEEAFDSKIKNMLSAKLAEELEEDLELEEEYMEEDEPTSEIKTQDEDEVTEDFDFDLEEGEEEDPDEEINLDELMAELEEMNYDEDEAMDEAMGEDEVSENIGDYGASADPMNTLFFILGAVGLPLTVFLTMSKEDKKELLDKIKGQASVAKDLSVEKAKSIAAKLGLTKKATDESQEFDIDTLISEIESELEEGKKKDKDDEKVEEAKKKAEKAEEELEEALATVESLRESISEMNLLNSKLLYCNKLFRANSLNEAQKIKVIDALDKSSTPSEAKLVFETLQESFAFTGVEKRSIKEGLARASKPAGTAPKKVITESVDDTVSRFQKLANIKL